MVAPLALSFNLTPKALPTVAALQLQPQPALCYLANSDQLKKKHLQGTDNWGNFKNTTSRSPLDDTRQVVPATQNVSVLTVNDLSRTTR